MAGPEVVIYTTMYCSYCQSAKNLLTQKQIAFREIPVDDDRGARAAMVERAAGRTTVPQIFVGDRHVGGSDDLHALERAGQLDAILRDHAA